MRDVFFFFSYIQSIMRICTLRETPSEYLANYLITASALFTCKSLFSELSMQWPGCLHSGWSFSYATFHRFRWGWWLFEELNLAQFSSPRGLPPWFWLRVSVHSVHSRDFSSPDECFVSLQLSLEWGCCSSLSTLLFILAGFLWQAHPPCPDHKVPEATEVTLLSWPRVSSL